MMCIHENDTELFEMITVVPTLIVYFGVTELLEMVTDVKVKGHPITATSTRGKALLILNLGARRGWVVIITPRPLYLRERPGNHCTGDWVGPRAGLDVCKKYRRHRNSIPGPSNP
jgi:hypothetical protein